MKYKHVLIGALTLPSLILISPIATAGVIEIQPSAFISTTRAGVQVDVAGMTGSKGEFNLDMNRYRIANGDDIPYSYSSNMEAAVEYGPFQRGVLRPGAFEFTDGGVRYIREIDEETYISSHQSSPTQGFPNFELDLGNPVSASSNLTMNLAKVGGGAGILPSYTAVVDAAILAETPSFFYDTGWYSAGSNKRARIYSNGDSTADVLSTFNLQFSATDDELPNRTEIPFIYRVSYDNEADTASGLDKERTSLIRVNANKITSATRDGEAVFGVEERMNTSAPIRGLTAQRSPREDVLNPTLSRSDYVFEGVFTDRLDVYADVAARLTGDSRLPLTINDGFTASLIVGQGATQANPFMPDISDFETGVFSFKNAVSGGWFDPITFENYLFSMDSSDSFFSDILSFPVGYGNEFGLYAIDGFNKLFDLGDFLSTENVDLQALLGGLGAKQFLVTGIDNNDDNHQFPLQLAFSSALADFTMQGVEDAEAFLASFRSQQGPTNQVSEPATLGALMFGLSLLLYRSRKSSR